VSCSLVLSSVAGLAGPKIDTSNKQHSPLILRRLLKLSHQTLSNALVHRGVPAADAAYASLDSSALAAGLKVGLKFEVMATQLF